MCKKKWMIGGVLLVLLLGGALFFGVQKVFHATSDTSFCVLCHSMTQPKEEWEGSKHFSNAKGIRAECADCHLPPDSLHYLKAKVLALKDVYGELTGKIPDAEAYETHRLAMAQTVWDDMKANDSASCRTCHNESAWILSEQEENAQKMHAIGKETQQTCIDCHKGIVHFMPEQEVDSSAANSALIQHAGEFSAGDKTLYALQMTAFTLEGTDAGRLLAFAPVADWQMKDQQVSGVVTGWQQQGAESLLYFSPGQRIIQALLDDSAKEKLHTLQEIDDEATGSRWRQVQLDVSLPAQSLTSNRTALDSYGAGLNQTYCSGCHAPIGAEHYSANQWIGVIRAMQDRTSITEDEARTLTLYLQYNAKDIMKNH